MAELTNAERETYFSMTADNRDEYQVFSDDPIMQRRIEAVGEKLVKANGTAKFYTLPANQISLRNPPKPMSEERKVKLAMQLSAARGTSVITGAEQANYTHADGEDAKE